MPVAHPSRASPNGVGLPPGTPGPGTGVMEPQRGFPARKRALWLHNAGYALAVASSRYWANFFRAASVRVGTCSVGISVGV
jgi:hypothetical protein